MPLEWQKLFIPVSQGLAQSIDERVRPSESLATVENGYWDRDGAISKRHGLSVSASRYAEFSGGAQNDYPLNTTNSGTIRALASTGEELVCVTDRKVMALDDQTDDATSFWRTRGEHSPFVGQKDVCMASQHSYLSVDSCAVDTTDQDRAGRLIVHAGIIVAQGGSGVGTTQYGLEYRVDAQNGSNHLPTRVIIPLTSTAADTPVAVRIISCTASATEPPYIVIAVQFGATTPGLDIYCFSSLSPQSLYELATPTIQIAAGRLHHRGYGKATFAICDTKVANEFALSFADDDAANHITYMYDASDGTPSYSRIITTESSTICALDYDYEERQVVLAVHVPNGVYLYGYTDALVVNFSGILLSTTTTDEDACQSIGVAVGNNGTEDRYAVAWSGEGTDPSTPTPHGKAGFYVRHRSTDNAGASLDNIQVITNTAMSAQPFWHDRRCYLPCATTCGAQAGWDTHVLMRLLLDDSNPITFPSLAGVYAPGLVGSVYDDDDEAPTHRHGGAVAVTIDDSDRYVWGACVLTFNMIPPETVDLVGGFGPDPPDQTSARLSGVTVRMDPNGTPLMVSPMQGAAIIGGSVVEWYDGERLHELGFAAPPVGDFSSDDHTTTTDPGLEPNDGYDWFAHWEWTDANGVLHRSAPIGGGNGTDATRKLNKDAVTEDSIGMDFRCLGATSRGANPSVAIYRQYVSNAGVGEGILRRCSQPLRLIPNARTALTVEFRDQGQLNDTSLPPLYTETAELEPSITEGASILAVVNERLWLSGFYDRDRVAYSKKLTPGTANESIVAPEFHEGFAFALPDGRECTGLSGVDDKVLVFSPDRIWIIAGDGPDITGAGNDFSGLSAISSDTGCIEHRSVAAFPGGVMFQSTAGIYLVGRDHQLTFIGEGVRDETDAYPVITSAVVVPKASHVRFTCQNTAGDECIILVFDYRTRQWAKWTTTLVINAACVHNDVYYVAAGAGVWQEDPTTWVDRGAYYYSLKVRLNWIQQSQPGGWQRIRKCMPVLRYKTECDINVKFYHDYATTETDTHVFTDGQIRALGNETDAVELGIRTTRQKCRAFSAEVYDSYDGDVEEDLGGGGNAYDIIGFQLEVGSKRGLTKTESGKKR